MKGTNNLGSNTIEDIAHGVKELLEELAEKMRATKMLMLGVLPRNGPLGAKPKQLNVLLKKMANAKTVYWLDMWSAFETPEGKQRTELYMGDLIHLNGAGYEAWHNTMDPILTQLLNN